MLGHPTSKRKWRFVELVYDKRNVEAVCQRTRNHPHELTKRVHQTFPDAQVKVKPMQANALNSDRTKTEKERLHRMLEEMFEEADMWLVAE
ncbi:DinI family protein [Salmonella enterica subsp. enterica]|nr:DinI family protein [Salmonella enterica subsp. enterica]